MSPSAPHDTTRYSCHECGTKYYDLNKAKVACPKCGSDPKDDPRPKSKDALIERYKIEPGLQRKPDPEPEPEPEPESQADAAGDPEDSEATEDPPETDA